jgi:tRNA pseudouridine55 synthase
MATGVLVLGFGRATRLLGHLMLTEKTYDATVRLGVATTTDDAEGEVVAAVSAEGVTEQAVRDALEAFVGDIQQVPSSVSAIKVDGRRAYALARKGEQVELAARPVTIRAIDVGEFRRDGEFLDFRLGVSCSSGTYIRAIARDLGNALGVGGHLTSLRRTSVGPFTLENADVDPSRLHHVVPIREAARAAFPAYDLVDEQAAAVRVGRPLELALEETTAVFAPDGEFLALYAPRDGLARPVAVFV